MVAGSEYGAMFTYYEQSTVTAYGMLCASEIFGD